PAARAGILMQAHSDIDRCVDPQPPPGAVQNIDPAVDHVAGRDFPEDLGRWALVVHCGNCMGNRKEMLSRLLKCREAGVPVTNYGLTIAYSLGIFERALEPFPAALDVVHRTLAAPEAVHHEEPPAASGISAPGLDREKRWEFVATAKPGDRLEAGDIIGTVQENEVIEHRIMVPPGLEGELVSITGGEHTVTEPVAQLRLADGSTRDLVMMQSWPVRVPRPYARKISADRTRETLLRFVGLMHAVGKPATSSMVSLGAIHFDGHELRGAEMCEETMRRLRFSNDEIVLAMQNARLSQGSSLSRSRSYVIVFWTWV
ncbi:MAG: hypothetical protein HGB17_17330, partial [Syntrophobacteraceae bacterium]|nr:hypothetical protein [Syntrophobacteraceae bacterium]